MSLNAVLWPSWLGSITASRNQTVFNSIQYNYIIDQQSKISLKNSQCDGGKLIHYPELGLQQKPVVPFWFFRNIYLFTAGSSLLRLGFLQLWQTGGYLSVVAGGATLCHGVWASHYGCFSYCGTRAPGIQASGIGAPGLSCSTACGIFPDQGSKLCSLHWQVNS